MSVKNVERVLKKIKNECYKKGTRYPKYYAPFLDEPAGCNIFELATLFEELKKRENEDDCQHEKTLYKYLLQDKSEYMENSYAEELEALLLK